ncbi:Lactate utilization protein A [Paraburkholderia sediminicola]|uniref:Glycolate oxidase iron-sulfur subunit n=1 Tax=Paraburkholderia sediminicola TaxID=458836 RepID=A0A6J5CNL7_9BURK|nr:glycolate oxidase subunit GlcF [Paraburkholderia sediminicola]CAB3741066.1 Lactate utilization protein A [Paraburkholderia sediminicola]
MKTDFTEAQLAQPHLAEADQILRSCQHFGFCTSGCPTYVLLHDENDGPRGRIDLIKEMLESDAPPTDKAVEHIDRCLSCMSCMTTCAVKVDYMHLVDTARAHIAATYKRPLAERLLRRTLGYVLPRPAMFRLALGMGRLMAPFERFAPAKMRHMLRLVPPGAAAGPSTQQTVFPSQGPRKWRVALLAGCVQPVMSPHINVATIALLTRFGCEVVVPRSAGCCGSLNLHMGDTDAARGFARANVASWLHEIDGEGLDAILINASGCGTTVKDYAHLLSEDTEVASGAARVAALAMDFSEWLVRMELPPPEQARRYRVAYHDACSLRNAQKVTAQPRKLLRKAGFEVVDVPESHFCCGSAGTYNMLQPELARQLGERKAENIASTLPQIVAAGNIGCITQIGLYARVPIVHTVELLDWAYGGALPQALNGHELEALPAEQAIDASPEETAGAQVIRFVNNNASREGDVGVW